MFLCRTCAYVFAGIVSMCLVAAKGGFTVVGLPSQPAKKGSDAPQNSTLKSAPKATMTKRAKTTFSSEAL